VRAITNEAEGLLSDTTQLTEIYKNSGKSRLPMWFAIGFSLLALAMLLLLGKVFLDDARVRASESDQENKRNQEAILRL
jgi:twitching motility protein PilJ